MLHSGLIDGVVLSSLQTNDPLIDAFLERDFPFVVVGRIPEKRPVHFVNVDNIGSACQAVEHLIQCGKNRIATIAGPQIRLANADRLEGYQQALIRAKIPMDPNLIIESDFTQEGGYAAMKSLLIYRPDAVFAASDAMAQGAARAIRDAGLSIPTHIALIGFDDMPFAAHIQPPLTTIRQPIEQMGSLAAELLIGLLTKPARPHRSTLSFPPS